MALFRISNFVTRISGSDQIFRLNIDVYYSASAGWRVIFNDMYFVEEQVDSFRQFQNEIGQCSAMYIIQEAVQGYEPYKFIPVDVYVPCVLDVFEVVKSERNGYDVHQVRIEITVPPQIK